MEGDAPVLMATTSLSGILNVIYEVHAALLAATIRLTRGGAGRAGFMGGTHRGWPAVPHCAGARVTGIIVLACPEIAMFFFQAEDGIRDYKVTGVQTCALPI